MRETSFMHGKIKWFDTKKGYGFINSDEGIEYFVHYTGVNHDPNEFVKFNPGDEVEFELTDGAKGVQAVNVTLVKAAPVVRAPRKRIVTTK